MNTTKFIHTLFTRHQSCTTRFPDKVLAIEFVDRFFEFLFIPEKQKKLSEAELAREYESFKSHLSTLVYDVVADGNQTQILTNKFL